MRLSDRSKTKLQYLTLVLPGLAIFTIGMIVPMFMGLSYSFTSWDGMTVEKPFIGLENYATMLGDRVVWQAWGFTFRFTILNTIIQNVAAILLAVALDSSIKFKKFFRSVFFIPCLIAAVVVGFIWLKIYGNILPEIMKVLGLDWNPRLLGSQDTVLAGLLIANNWQWIGYWMMIYLAALQTIPKELYEAARIDGAGRIAQFFRITIPMLAPAITICVVGITVGSLRVYDLLVSSTSGGPGRASTSIIYYIFNAAIRGRQYGYGSALTMTLIVILLVIAALQIRVLRRREVQM